MLLVLAGCTGATDESDGAGDPPATAPTSPPAEPDPTPEPPDDEPEPEPEPDPVPESRAALTAQLERLVTRASATSDGLQLGVLVIDEHGREVVAADPDLPLLPASTMKQITAAAALTTLGPTAELRTVVDATAGIAADGTLDGDLIVIGSGDPTLVTEEYARFVYPARPRASLDALADQLVAQGLTQVTGHVRGSAPAFGPPSLPEGWRDNYLDSLDGRYVAGLTVDGGLVTTIQLPEIDDADDADDEQDPDEEQEQDEEPEEEPWPPVNILDQLAALDTDVAPTVRTSLAADPVLHVATELTRMLEERGVEVAGPPTTEAAERPVTARLATITSPPLADVLRFMVQRSDNHLSDGLALIVARARTNDGSWPAVPRAFTQVLERFDVPAEGAVFADGSGLSREDRVTARLLAELDRQLTGSARFGGVWRSLQAVAGESGTLQARLRGTPAEGRLLGKTGTLRDVASLSGQVIGVGADPLGPAEVGERRYHFAVVGNDAAGAGRFAARALVDEIALALIADLDGCDFVVDDTESPLERPQGQVRCP